MKLVDRYIITLALKAMLATFVIGVVTLTLARLVIILKLRAIDDQDIGTILQMLGYFMPNYFGFMLPFSLFWACFMVTRRLSGGSETRAFTAAGVSQKRLFVPFLILSLFTLAANLFVYGWMEPIARYKYRSVIHRIENTAAYLTVQAGVFMKVGNRIVYVDQINRAERTFKGLMIYETAADGTQREVIAARGQLIMAGNDSVLRLEDGNRIRLAPVHLNAANLPKPAENLAFTQLDIPLTQDSNEFHRRGKDEEELTVPELLALQDAPPKGVSIKAMTVQLNHKLVVIFTALILPFLAIAMAQSGPRGAHYLKGPVAFLLVITYQQIVEFAKVFASTHHVSPSALLWGVFAAMAAVSVAAFTSLDVSRDNIIVLFFGRLFRVIRNAIASVIDRFIPQQQW